MKRFLCSAASLARMFLLPLSLAFVHAASGGSVQIFGNNTAITITNHTTATPYPSNTTVSGVTVNTATKIQVVLSKFSHAYPADVDVLLVGPQGQRCMLMSDAAGGSPIDPATPVTLTFSSTAATVLPQNTAPVMGGYRPANYVNDGDSDDLTDTFPSPGPGTLTNQAADLTVFNLTNPNGTWSLYVVDDASPDAGSIASGWLLLVTVPTVFTVNSTADTNDGVCDADCSLREALALAQNGDLINFSSAFNTPQTINLLTALPDITKSVTIQGPGANLLTVRRDYNAATDFRVFNIAGGITNGVAISGMTITGGNAGSGLFGGGIYGQSNLTLTNVHVTGNTADAGGGVTLAFADGAFTNCTFSNNSSTNAAGNGAGIQFLGDGGHTLRLVSSTVSGNRSANGGGGVFNSGGDGNSRLEITNSTIVNNTGNGNGGGIFTYTQNGAGNTATTTLRNSIVAGNTPNNLATGTVGGGAATFTTLGFNLSDNYNGVLTKLGTDKTAQPLLGPLSLIGGQTPAHALLAGSPALAAGDSSDSTTDQRGQPRLFGASADIGAVEMRALIVTSNADPGDGTCDATCTLRDAITAANANGAGLDDILFSNTLFNTSQAINLLTPLPDITNSVTLNGPGAHVLTVRRDFNAATDFRVFNIAFAIPDGVAISGMTINNGRATAAAPGNLGGGIYSESKLVLTGVHVTGNTAVSSGGGALLAFADGIFTNCTFSGNRTTGPSAAGGGIFYQGDGGHTLRLISSTVSGNQSVTNAGGGIGHGSFNASSRVEITNSAIVNNTGPGGGGILTFTATAGNTATTTFRNTIVAGNSSNNLAIISQGGPATATFATLGFNLSDNYNGLLTALGTDKTAQPLLGPLSLIGGQTPTHALLAGSPALDAGDASGLTTDQRGQPRLFGASADIGAVEMRPLIVTTTANSGVGSLRTVLASADADSDLTDVLFDNTVFNKPQTITLTTGALAINSNLNIIAPGANLLTVSGNNASRVFNIASGIPNGVAISGMTITGGSAGDGNFGGGVTSQSYLSLTSVHVTGNTAGSGGGVSLASADGIFRNCAFSNNSSTNATGTGGGIFFQGNSDHTLRLVSSTVSGNHSANKGGGIENLSGSSGGNSRMEITNSTIANNTANVSGGGILTFTQNNAGSTATTTLRNTIVAGNSSNNLATESFGGGATTFTTLGFNLSNNFNGVFASPLATDITSTTPQLGPLADNGGTTPTHALLFDSPALDAGNNSGSGANLDQRGVTRPVDLAGITNAAGSDGTDIGAYEAQTAPPSPTPTPTATPTAIPTASPTATPTASPTATPGLVGNVSTRLPVGVDENVLIEGFIVQGPAGSTKKIVIRAIGPSLIPFGITDALANPTLEIHDSSNAIVATNNDWKTTQVGGLITSDQTAAITASQVAPSNDLESAIIADLAPGSYTALVRGLGNTTGTGVVDAYDLSAGSPAKLANIATRGLIQPGDKLMIAGFIIQNGSVRAVVRAIGPSLIAFGIANALPDTTLQLRDQNGDIVLENDDWQTSQKQELENTGLQPSHDLEAAVVTTLQPGQYTAQVRGKGNASGIGVVQVYFLQ